MLDEQLEKAALITGYGHGFNQNKPSLKEPHCLEIHDTNQQVLVLQGKTLIAVPHDELVDPKKLCLCCAESEGKPKLKLEERDIMELYHTQKAEKSFVFFQNASGNTSTFQSAAYPGWFTCSSKEKGKPITMTKNVGKDNVNFYFNHKN
ncbi:interleukin-36 beta-like [Trichosurus vulpecula]|uniref:interleukin-36 beta-like n=1 Tax=Trichosurus vulpecula TaxID=9337 RepID=UPI00186B38BF|nr:interleukin-36 beta-like [Trichosurus vulpecula]